MINNSAQVNKTVLVTGAARRIGAAICRKFHHQGYNVIIHCNRSTTDGGKLAEELNQLRKNTATLLQADLTCEHQVESLAAEAAGCFGCVDVLINNASMFYPTPFGEVTTRQWHELMDSNLKAAFFLSQSLVKDIRSRGGAIVNLIDIYADKPLKNYPAYSIAKAGLKAMTRSLAIELAPQARANGVSPGAILWPTGQENMQTSEDKQAIIEKIPLGRLGSPDDIAEAVYFVAVEATYITGAVIRVDGGRTLNL